MAEAHQGVAFSFSVTEDEGLHLNVSLEALRAVLSSGSRSWRKKLARLINSILNGCYPSHPSRGLVIIALLSGLRLYKNIDVSFGLIDMLKDKIPESLIKRETSEIVATITFGTTCWLLLVGARKYMLRALFSYQGWIYEVHGKPSLRTKLWMTLVKLSHNRKPFLFSYQNSLPYLPLPSLDETVERYLRSVRPLLDDENYARIEKSAIDFKKTVGKRLQRYLLVKWWISGNYVSDWWEEYVYLRGRSPIMVNSNYYGLDTLELHPTKIQAAKAGNAIHATFLYRRELNSETLKPVMIQDTIPICSRQYERQFNTSRIPGEITDKLVHNHDSKHVAVYCKGKWYKLNVYYQSILLNPKEIEVQIQKIIDDANEASESEKHIAALTAGDRVPWAQARKKYFSKGTNKTSLDIIEKAAFVVILEDEPYKIQPTVHKEKGFLNEDRQIDRYARAALHGKGYDRWFDKSLNLIFTQNGRMCLNSEHSWADAPITGHLWESIIADDTLKLGYDESGHTKGIVRFDLPMPQKLNWKITPDCHEVINASLKTATDLINDVDLHVYVHDFFGKGFMKKCRISPDAFIQMALQLAYYREMGKHHLTYESSMTRLFREGRTETVRSCSIESSNWVKAMVSSTATNDEKISLLIKACEHHQQLYRDAMTGKGVDRHLFCLYVVSKYLELDIPFLKEILSEPWRLSTSQTPAQQSNKFDLKKNPEMTSFGGGFGPVADDGYGVSYIVSGEDVIFFHISSKKSCDKTDSYRFGQAIKQALLDMKAIFDESFSKKKEAK